ncbi:cupin domain-containing protein [Arthrobacter roseus]|uniref:cupin domain-containing protein n=1 Tax=Arthrobacter roseus TaxID=136274 RepID=UPI001962B608|nr:AraC-like DNA-binding protein [Arthrobacter roseus]
MDPITHFLDGPRATRAFAVALEMASPWGLDVADGAALTVLAVTHGQARVDGHLLEAGDLTVVRGPEPYLVSDAAGSAPSIRIDAGQCCTSLDGRDLRDEFRRGIRRWGNASKGDTSLLVAIYERPDEIGGLVSRALPRTINVPSQHTDIGLVDLLTREVSKGDPAAQVMIDRLLDMLVISSVRHWLNDSQSTHEATWLTCSDPLIVQALEHLHAEPAASWTVKALAERLHISRASLAARFREGVGEPPMAYLTRWRMTLAGDLLLTPGSTVTTTARRVGYHDAFAFSNAFKRNVGMTPTEWRQRQPQRKN